MNRLKSLCSIHGVGLVVFTLDKEQPDYSVGGGEPAHVLCQ